MPREYSHNLAEWITQTPSVKTWVEKLAVGSKKTAEVYASLLWKFWRESLLPRGYKTIDQYVDEVLEHSEAKDKSGKPDLEARRAWGKTLQDWYMTTKLARPSRFVLIRAVKSFLKERVELAEYKFQLSTREQKIAEKKAEQERLPLTSEELRTLVNEGSTRDKAIILTQISGGLGVGEFLQFAGEWKKYEKDIRPKQSR